MESIQVCTSCHGDLRVDNTPAVSTTGEFAVSELMELAERARAEPATPPRRGTPACSWCKRAQDQVRKLLSQGGLHICNECVGFCADIMRAELGDDWSS